MMSGSFLHPSPSLVHSSSSVTYEASSTRRPFAQTPSSEPFVETGAAGMLRRDRSRNALAQARHRAKRKAYLAQLEQSVENLQSTLGIVPGREYETPPLVMKVRKLERENEALRWEVYDLRRQIQAKGHVPSGGYTPDHSASPGAEGRINGQDVGGSTGNTVGAFSLSSSSDLRRLPPLNFDAALDSGPSFTQRPHDNSSGSHYPPTSPINYAYGVQGYCTPTTATRSTATTSSQSFTTSQYTSSHVPVIQHHVSSSDYTRRAQSVFPSPTYDPRFATLEGEHYQGDIPDLSTQGSPYFPTTVAAVSPPPKDSIYPYTPERRRTCMP